MVLNNTIGFIFVVFAFSFLYNESVIILTLFIKLALSESRLFRAHRRVLFMKQCGLLSLLVYAAGI